MRVLIACEHSGVVREQFRARGHDAWSCDLLPASDESKYHFVANILTNRQGGFPILKCRWDLLIAHPPCTYLTNSAAWAFKDPDFAKYPGVGYHQKVKPGTLTGEARRKAREEAVQFALALWNCGIERICIENPVGHLGRILGKSQLVHPYQFGDDASKGTCLWRKGLPELAIDPRQRKQGRFVTPWIECPEGCGEFWCNLHRKHASECACKPIDEWDLDPYSPCIERWSNQADSGQNCLSPSDDRGHLRAITYPGIARAMAEQWGGAGLRTPDLFADGALNAAPAIQGAAVTQPNTL